MTTESESTTQTVETLKAQLETMGVKFRDYVRRSSGKISKLQEQVRELDNAMADDGDAIKADGEELLEDMESRMAFAASQVATTSSTTTTTTTKSATRQSAKKATRGGGRKQKVKDSGIGMDDEDEDMVPA